MEEEVVSTKTCSNLFKIRRFLVPNKISAVLFMKLVNMSVQSARLVCGITTKITFIGLFSGMSIDMLFHCGRMRHSFLTIWTGVAKASIKFYGSESLLQQKKFEEILTKSCSLFLLLMMCSFMFIKTARLPTSIVTKPTLIRFFTGMNGQMSPNIRRKSHDFVANWTSKNSPNSDWFIVIL